MTAEERATILHELIGSEAWGSSCTVIPTWVTPTEKYLLKTHAGGSLIVYRSPLGEMPVLHVRGTCEQIGRQYGALVGDMVRRNADRILRLFTVVGLSEDLTRQVLDIAWSRLRPHVPQQYLREMTAVAEGAQEAGFDVSLPDLECIMAVTNFDLYKREERIAEMIATESASRQDTARRSAPMSCTMFAVWGSRTVGGKMFAHRNLDWVSQTGMHKDRLVTVYEPEDGCAFATIGYAGVLGALAGMNEKSITLAEVGAFSAREELDGTPWTFMARRVLQEAASLKDALDIIQSTCHTLGYNYLVSDGDADRYGTPLFRPRAAVFETNHECCEVFFDDDPKEHDARWTAPDGRSIRYGTPLKEAVFRADTAFGRRTRELQAADNGPGEPLNDGDPTKHLPGNSYWECHRPMHDMIRAYETGSDYVYPLRGTKVIEAGAPRKIGPDEALTMAATVAHNVEKLNENDWNVMSVVFAATDLDFWVAYEHQREDGAWTNAPDTGYWKFSLKTLLEEQP